MKQSIFHIEKEYIEIVETIRENGGEITPEQIELLAVNKTNLETKGVNYAMLIRSLEHHNTALKTESDRYAKMRKVNDNLIKRLKDTVSDAMKLYEVEEIKGEFIKLNFRKSTQLITEGDVDVDVLKKNNPLFVTTKTTESINKTEITNVLKSGVNVVGFHLQENKNLQIK